MKYLLYLWRSILRRPGRHLTLYGILTCAFLLPLVISIYRDSAAYGDEQERLDVSKGAAFHIYNAREEYLQYFEGIAGLSQPSFENGTIYLSILSEDEWRNEGMVSRYGGEVGERMSLTGDENLSIIAFQYEHAHGISTDNVSASGQRVLFLFNCFIILVSVFVAQSAYKSHLNHFSPEIGTLISCGANRRQIMLIFVAEFAAVFSLAALSAILISAGVMKLLFGFFLEISDVSGLAWVIFRMDPANTLLHLLVYFVSSALVLGVSLWRNSRKSTGTLLRGGAMAAGSVKAVSAGRRPFDMTPPPSAALSRLWRRRTNGSLINCLLISVPVMTIFLFLFNYLVLDIEIMTAAPAYELHIFKDVFQAGGFSEEEIAYVEGMEEVKEVARYRKYYSGEALGAESGSEVVDRLDIALDNPRTHKQVEEALEARFLEGRYRIVNKQEPVDYMREISGGIYMLLAYLFGILFLFTLIILSIKLCDYIADCRNVIRSLYVIGASRRDLYRSYMLQVLPAAVAAAATPVVVSGILSGLVAASLHVTSVWDGGVIAIYAVVGVLIAGSFLYPTHRTLKKVLRDL